MAPQKSLDLGFAAEIVEIPVADEMSESFLAYSLSVITSRAIPDVRDGLKPVQRRILYSMLNMGIRPDTPHRKSARVVGDTMGKYHPHGDSAIYDALVRMGQDFSRNVTLIDPQGNFGSLDDPPAASRYTECRLSFAAMEMLGRDEIDQDTVAYRPTYDGESTEPEYLPGKVPNLLVNGTTGIAVGMATNMAPHNLIEVADAIKLVLNQRRPKPTVDELMAVLPGPDLPSGAIVVDDSLRDAYENGKGSFRMRARAEFEQITAKRQGIVITELPYMIGPEKIVAKVKDLANSGKITGISGITNLSDRKSGLRILIECQPGVNPQGVLANLYRLTPLEETFAINNVVLVDGTPTTVSLFDLCHHYIQHRLDVIVKRTEFRLKKARERLHILEGLVIALDNIDLVVSIIRGSQTVAEAKAELQKQLKLSEIQATHILDMPLRRLVALARQEIIDERDLKLAEIDDYLKLLKSEKRQRTLVEKELDELVEQFGEPRRSKIMQADDIEEFVPAEVETLTDVPDEPCVVTLSTSGQIGRAPTEGATRATPGRHDLLVASVITSTDQLVHAITSHGRVLSALAFEIGEVAGRSRGAAANQVFGTNKGEDILTIVTATGTEPIVLVTRNGIAKRVTAEEVAGTTTAKLIMKLKDTDRIAAAFPAPEGVDIVIVASDAQALRTPASDISVQGRGASGVAGMKLRPGASVVAAGPVLGDGIVATVTDLGTAKATPFEDITSKGRGGQGVRLTKFTKEKTIVLAHVGSADGLMVFMSTDDDHRKQHPNPVKFPVESSARDLVSTATERPIMGFGPARW